MFADWSVRTDGRLNMTPGRASIISFVACCLHDLPPSKKVHRLLACC